MLRKTALSITPAVTELFNISIRLGELPDEWKASHVSPIPKSDNHSDPAWKLPSNIIELLSILSKLLEKHICDVISYLPTLKSTIQSLHSSGGLLVEHLATTGSLLDATDQWFRELEQDHDICTVLFDYSKAFDTIPHRPLLQSFKITVFTDRS